MGNCMTHQSQPKKQTRDHLIEGREMEVDASVPVEKINYTSFGSYIVSAEAKECKDCDDYRTIEIAVKC
ncbi:hypothetical protein RIF29_40842 [Crotalaria pallida]|uniref:Uncharacterized protein n=1 Tax=Crotalaria pallida TaxID=3830 RepID=A0AAN9HNU4_CROPI